jgi:hypothetical protein
MTSWNRLLLASALTLALAGCGAGSPDTPSGGSPSPSPSPPASAAGGAAAGSCGSAVETGPLPDWADAGFSGDSSMPHVFGAKGEIVAVLFGHPLAVVKPVAGPTNKILWVAKPAPAFGDTLKITARLDKSDVTAEREVAGGPGPSILDLPQAGCWRLTLTWSDRVDTMDLTYAETAG